MVRGELVVKSAVSSEDVIVRGTLSSASAEASENMVWCSGADFVGEANRLSGRMCSKLRFM